MSGFHNINGEPVMLVYQCQRPERGKRKPTVKNGYAAQPGTGPDGKTCRDCEHKVTCGSGHAKSWIKCELRKATWTSGEGTDILASSPACSKFEPRATAAPNQETS